MGIVIGGLVGIIIIASVIWLFALYGASSAEQRQRAEVAAAAAEASRRAERDRRMYTQAIELRCAACNELFNGPLTAEGCPTCHSCALVVPEDEYVHMTAQG